MNRELLPKSHPRVFFNANPQPLSVCCIPGKLISEDDLGLNTESEDKCFPKSSAWTHKTFPVNPTGRLLSSLAQPLAFEHAVPH